MENELDAIVENWYLHLDKGQSFQVIAVDDETRLVEIQHIDGDLEEVSFDEWGNMAIELCEEPPNWRNALDVAELDDLGTEVTDTSESDWDESLDQFTQRKGEKLTPEP